MDGLHLMVKVTRDSLMDVSRFLYSISRLFPIPYFSVRSQMSIVELDWSPSWSLASHAYGHFVLCPVLLASRDQDCGLSNSTMDIHDLAENRVL